MSRGALVDAIAENLARHRMKGPARRKLAERIVSDHADPWVATRMADAAYEAWRIGYVARGSDDLELHMNPFFDDTEDE